MSGEEQEETTTEPSEPDQSILMPSSSNSIPISVSSSQVLEPSILDMNEVDGSISTSSTAKIFTKMSTTSEPMISETSSNTGKDPGNNPGNTGISQSSSNNQSRSFISTSTIAATSGGRGSEAIISTTKTEQSFLGKQTLIFLLDYSPLISTKNLITNFQDFFHPIRFFFDEKTVTNKVSKQTRKLVKKNK